MEKKDYYEILGVSKTATDEEIKRSFRKLAKQYHPDVNKEAGSEEKFKEIGEAYAILSDAEKRRQYDQFGHAAFQNGGNGGGFGGFGSDDIDLSSIFDDLFGGSFGGFGFGSGRGKSSNRAQKGRDRRVSMDLTFDEAIHGVTKTFSLDVEENCTTCDGLGGTGEKTCSTCGGTGRVVEQQRSLFGIFQSEAVCSACHGSGKTIQNTCTACRGSGYTKAKREITVNVPEGVDNGYQLKISGKGERGQNGGPNGDIYLEFRVKESPIFERENDDIYLELPISIVDAVLGAKKDIPTIDGVVVLEIKSGTQNGTKLKLKGKGVKLPNSLRKGDMFVIVKVITPTKLSREQKKIFDELSLTDLKNESEFKQFDRYL